MQGGKRKKKAMQSDPIGRLQLLQQVRSGRNDVGARRQTAVTYRPRPPSLRPAVPSMCRQRTGGGSQAKLDRTPVWRRPTKSRERETMQEAVERHRSGSRGGGTPPRSGGRSVLPQRLLPLEVSAPPKPWRLRKGRWTRKLAFVCTRRLMPPVLVSPASPQSPGDARTQSAGRRAGSAGAPNSRSAPRHKSAPARR